MSRPKFLKKIISFAKVLLVFCGSLLTICLSQSELKAQGNLLVTPRRIIFEGNKKTQELNLANTGQDSARYLISLVEIRMKEDGSFEEISKPDSGQFFASDYLRFFPRSVTLAPKEAQVVKIQLKNTSELGSGEYRSHIYFRAVPEEKPLGEPVAAKEPSTISVRLTPIFGITLPVIIRVGKPTAEVKLTDLYLENKNDTTTRLNLTFNRTGNMSVYGDIKVNFVSNQGIETQVGLVKGVAIYTPNLQRHFHLDLEKKKGINFNEGKFHVVYTPQSDNKSEGFAEAFCTSNENLAKTK